MDLMVAKITFRFDTLLFQDFPREEEIGCNRKQKVKKPGTAGEMSRPS